MLRRILIIVLTGSVPLALLHWGEQPGHHVPQWLRFISVLPFFWVAMSDDEYWEDSESARGFGIVYAFGASVFLIFVGMVGLSLKGGGLGELLVFALPVGVIALFGAFLGLWFRSR